MLRFDLGEERISTTRNFRVGEGGGDAFAAGLFYGVINGRGMQWHLTAVLRMAPLP